MSLVNAAMCGLDWESESQSIYVDFCTRVVSLFILGMSDVESVVWRFNEAFKNPIIVVVTGA